MHPKHEPVTKPKTPGDFALSKLIVPMQHCASTHFIFHFPMQQQKCKLKEATVPRDKVPMCLIRKTQFLRYYSTPEAN
jgi:hypothetical protein